MKDQFEASQLTEKELQFCCNFVSTGNCKESALRAGYKISPEKAGAKLLAKSKICEEIQRLYRMKKQNLNDVACSGYERLAFGNISDAIRLLFMEKPETAALEEMDLFNVSEIKRLKEGAMEIKFFDRLRALEKLQQASATAENGAVPFYQALEKGVQAFRPGKDEVPEEV